MGAVYDIAKKYGLIHDYASPGLVLDGWKESVVQPGKAEMAVPVADMTAAEVDLLMHKLDNLALTQQNDAIAKMCAEEIPSVITMVRRVKKESGGSFSGILGAGTNLDLFWLRPKDIGGPILNTAAAGALGMYTGAGGGIFTWLVNAASTGGVFVANAARLMIPGQAMLQWAACLHLGLQDTIDIPKCNMIQFTIAALATPPQSLFCNNKRKQGQSYDNSLCRFEKPIMVSPLTTQIVSIMPNIAGDSRPELLTLVCARIQDILL